MKAVWSHRQEKLCVSSALTDSSFVWNVFVFGGLIRPSDPAALSWGPRFLAYKCVFSMLPRYLGHSMSHDFIILKYNIIEYYWEY